METVTVHISDSDLQKLEEITDSVNANRLATGGSRSMDLSGAAWSALHEGIYQLHKAWVTK